MTDTDEYFGVGQTLARLETKVDKVLDDHEKRLRGMEKWRNRSGGAISVILVFVPVVSAITAALIR